MVKHSKEFIEKHERMLQQREMDKIERLAKKEQKKKETYKRKLMNKQYKYKLMKLDDESYTLYLDKQKEYREKYKAEKEKAINERFSSCKKIKLINKSKFYYINESGNLYSSTGRLLCNRKDKNGYIQISNGQMLHRVVWEAFNGEIPEGMEIDHVNAIRDDNRLENLRLVTHKENCNNLISVENYRKHNKKVDRSYLKKKKV